MSHLCNSYTTYYDKYFKNLYADDKLKKESPPAWTQEAYRPPHSHSKSLLFRGRGVPRQKIFFPVRTCIKPNLVSKIFPFTGGRVPRQKFFFPSLNMYQAKSGVKNFSLYWRGGGGGGFPWQNFFFWSEHVSSQIWCQKFFPLLRLGTPLPDLRPDTPPDLRLGTPLDLGPAPTWTWTWDPPPPWPGTPLPGPGPGTPPRTDTHLWKHNLPSYVRTRAVKIIPFCDFFLEHISLFVANIWERPVFVLICI